MPFLNCSPSLCFDSARTVGQRTSWIHLCFPPDPQHWCNSVHCLSSSLCGFWNPNSDPHGCRAGSFQTGPFTQPLACDSCLLLLLSAALFSSAASANPIHTSDTQSSMKFPLLSHPLIFVPAFCKFSVILRIKGFKPWKVHLVI